MQNNGSYMMIGHTVKFHKEWMVDKKKLAAFKRKLIKKKKSMQRDQMETVEDTIERLYASRTLDLIDPSECCEKSPDKGICSVSRTKTLHRIYGS